MTKMKYHMLIALFFVLIFASAVHADVRTAINSVDPQPVEPGNDLTLKIGYTNFGATQVRMSSAIDLSYPFSLKSSTESFENGFDVCGFCSRTNNYFISVDPSAKSGTYPIYIRLSGTDGSEVKTINVSVRGTPNLILVSEPIANITPAQKFDMNLELQNIGTGLAREVKVTTKSSDFIALGATIQTTEKVDPHDSSFLYFAMSPGQNLDAGSYNLPFEISYKDEQGNSYTITQNIGVRVVNDGLLNIESIKVASPTGGQTIAGQPITVVIRLQNIGHGDANSIESQIVCDGQTSKAFLGQLKKNEDSPAVFDMTIQNGGKHTCTLTTKYSDDTGTKTMTNSFDINLKNPDFPVLPIIIVIIIAAIYYFKVYRKKK
ncbi:MAG: hypothetical protein NT120_04420 [Candidatus Aenigmarchaeota archaeon]|nr:hypothetical protein [Candidatus Aenigmarchaeota archaeon]